MRLPWGNRPQVLTQFCLAHVIRDLKFITTLPDQAAARWGHQMLAGMRRLFGVIHRRDRMTDAGFNRALVKARDALRNRARRGPPRREVQNLIAQFRKHGDAHFRFVTTPGIAPTNTLAEQALRCVVIDRRLTQGTRSPRGRQWRQRAWTAAATCRQQARSVFAYLNDTLHARLESHSRKAEHTENRGKTEIFFHCEVFLNGLLHATFENRPTPTLLPAEP